MGQGSFWLINWLLLNMSTSYQNAGRTHNIQEPVSTLKMYGDSNSCEHHYQIKGMLKNEKNLNKFRECMLFLSL
jgi:hypothetical protein